ncbi:MULTISPECIES: non-ribosomal peptide synthetase [unclassified Streptomyces]|uniref:non-ribosomal peptide synthetase n=1 Tax=unclassified Streptomyces TaxID=2593676 RepID=UPI001C1AAA60|nr:MULTISPECIES: non-ribosomal peptide synthetase [unclassified Streptomyces]MBT2408166.1 non-ribosomal peptide synthetase [Streptomyces sp. ISL-21]
MADSRLPEGCASADSVLDTLRAVAVRNPASFAVVGESGQLTYEELLERSGTLAAELSAIGVGPGDRVVVVQPPTLSMIVSVAAVMAAGAAYVPVDASQPEARIRAIVEDSGAVAVLSDMGEALPYSANSGVPVVSESMAAANRRQPEWKSPEPDGVAYVVYTSGSTGEPKGVLVSHGQLAYSTAARRSVYPDIDRFLLVSPLAFDSSVAGIWGTLTSGGCLVVASDQQRRDPAELAALIGGFDVTHTLMIPAMYRMVIDSAASGQGNLTSLRSVTVAGEALDDSLIQRHFEAVPGAELVNEYGPSEATVWATFRRYTEPAPSTIGQAVPGTRLYVLDKQQKPVAEGEPGELCVAGPGVTRGYLNRPAATEAAFLADPWGEPNERLYRTGDLVRRNERGELEFLGRVDRQVKLRGQRLQLEAVELVLRAVDGVADAAVLTDAERATLIAHLRLDEGADEAAVRKAAAEVSPAEYRPDRIHLHARFPVTTNGKVDLALLERSVRETGAKESEKANEERQNCEDLTERVIAAWREVLGVETVPPDVNFFDLGGSSLTLMKLQGALERHTGRHATVVSLFRHTTATAQAKVLLEGGDTGMTDRGDRVRRQARRRVRSEGDRI